MKPEDTFRIGGIPFVVVSDNSINTEDSCAQCAFKTRCYNTGGDAVSAIELWRGGDCITDRVHYEVRDV